MSISAPQVPAVPITRGASARIPTARYTSPDFAAREHARLWPRVWQIACTVDHVAEPGDFFEYRVGWYSVLVVRDAHGKLRAFQNACRHRGNAVCTGAGTGLTELRCPFHRWAWDLDGRLREIPSRSFFGPLDDDALGLIPAQVGTWGRLVFVNLDPDAAPLDEYLEGVPADAHLADPHDFRCSVTTTSGVACNWKVAVDGFSETYHIQGIHPQMLGSIDDIHATQRVWGRHSVSYQDYAVPSPRLGNEVTPETVWRSFVVTQGGRMGAEYTDPDTPMPPLGSDGSVRTLIADRVRAEHARAHGTDCAGIDDDRMLRLSQYNLFPNATVLLWGEMINVLIARPGTTPDDAHLDTFLLHRHPPGAPRLRPVDLPLPSDADFGFVLNADFGILATAQRGLHQPGLHDLVVSSEEGRIINTHRHLVDLVDEGGNGVPLAPIPRSASVDRGA